jgi:hypothetical protein
VTKVSVTACPSSPLPARTEATGCRNLKSTPEKDVGKAPRPNLSQRNTTSGGEKEKALQRNRCRAFTYIVGTAGFEPATP